MRTPGDTDPIYIAARRVLLDALDALAAHNKCLVLVGAQAIYLRIGEVRLPVAPYTTDGDILLDVRFLATEPQLEAAMHSGGFEPTVHPGVWSTAVRL